MFATRIILMLSLAIFLGGCAATPKIHLKAGDMAMEVTSNAPWVSRVAYSPDGKGAASGSKDGTLRLWDIESGKLIRKIKMPSTGLGIITDINYSTDGKSIITKNWNGHSRSSGSTIRFWDIKTGAEIKKIQSDNEAEAHVALSPDGKYLFYPVSPVTYGLLDVQSGITVREFKGDGEYNRDGLISPDDRYVYLPSWVSSTFSGFGIIRNFFDLKAGKQLWRTEASREWLISTQFSPDSKYLLELVEVLALSRSHPKQLRLIDVSTGEEARRFDIPTKSPLSVSFFPDGASVMVSGRGGSGMLGDRVEFQTWSIQTGAIMRQFGLQLDSGILDLIPPAFSPDNRFAIAGTSASLKLLNTSTGEELATMIGFEDGEWLVVTSDGYYNSSEKGDQYLSVSVGGKPYTISQLRESFYRPDLVKVALAGQKIEGLKKMADIKPPPSVAIINTPASVSSDQTTVSLQVKDQGGGIGDVRLYRNGTAVILEKTRNLQVDSTAQGGQVLRYTLSLEAGKNSIRAIAFNADNSMQSMDATMEIQASFASRPPTLYAVVVGIKDYVNPRLALTYPVADAELFAAALENKSKGLFDSIQVHRLLKPEETTNAAITAALKQAQKDVRPEDLFVFYVASHGTVDDGQYFLITSNVGSTSTAHLKQDALSQDAMKEMISNIPASKKLVVLDTCNAGKMGDALQMAMLTRGMSEDTAMKVLSRAVGSTILSAASSVQEALEGYKDHGLFTWVVVEGLNGAADADKDGFVKTLELADYVDNQVPELAEKVFNHKQFPIVSPTGQGFPLVRVR